MEPSSASSGKSELNQFTSFWTLGQARQATRIAGIEDGAEQGRGNVIRNRKPAEGILRPIAIAWAFPSQLALQTGVVVGGCNGHVLGALRRCWSRPKTPVA